MGACLCNENEEFITLLPSHQLKRKLGVCFKALNGLQLGYHKVIIEMDIKMDIIEFLKTSIFSYRSFPI
jgi:hypothetical protein